MLKKRFNVNHEIKYGKAGTGTAPPFSSDTTDTVPQLLPP
jgi:hypothetical protein